MRDLPDLSSIIEFRPEGPLPASGLRKVLDGFGLYVTAPSACEDQPVVLPTNVAASAPVGTGRKRSQDSDLGDRSGELDAIAGDLPDAPPAKKKKKSKKKRSAEEKVASVAEGVPQPRDEADDNLPPERGLDSISGQGTGVMPQKTLTTGQEGVPPVTPPKKKTKVNPEVEVQIPQKVDRADDRLGTLVPRVPLPDDDLVFRASYLDVVCQRQAADDSVDALVMKYDAELKASYVSLGKAQEEAGRGTERVAVLEASLGKAEELLASLSAEALLSETPVGVNPHGSNVGLIGVEAVAGLQTSEHALEGRSCGSVGVPLVGLGKGVSEGNGKDSTTVVSNNMEEEEEISGFNSGDGKGLLESDNARPMGEDAEL
ncbi:hypothetical protein Bca101_057872 [Brassica carinata]